MTLLHRTGTQVADRLSSELRWGLDHGLTRLAVAASVRRGDLQARMIAASDAETLRLVEEIRRADGGGLHRARFAYLAVSMPLVKETLTNPAMLAGVDFAPSNPVLNRMVAWAQSRAPLGPLTEPSLLVSDPPDHTRYRKLVTRVFSVRAVERLRERAEQVAADLLDDLEREAGATGGQPIDLVARYCATLPVTLIAEILGVPAHERGRVLRFGTGAAPSLDVALGYRRFHEADRTLREFDRWLGEHLSAVRRNPGEDLLSQLVTAVDDDGQPLTEVELKATAGLVLAAGFETTVNLLGNAVSLLCRHREQLGLLREQPDLWPNAVEEALRYDPPVLLTGRTAKHEVEIGGRTVAPGSVVTALLIGANRDPEVFDRPDRFDVARENAAEHVSFSSGRHYCLGAALARMEGEVGLRALFDRFPDLDVAPGGVRRDTRILRGWAELPVVLGAPARRRRTEPVGGPTHGLVECLD